MLLNRLDKKVGGESVILTLCWFSEFSLIELNLSSLAFSELLIVFLNQLNRLKQSLVSKNTAAEYNLLICLIWQIY